MNHLRKETEKLSIYRSLKIIFGFSGDRNSCFTCEYEYHGQSKIFQRSPLAFVNLLKQYGFIDEYKLTTCDIYIKEPGGKEWQFLEDYMESFSQFFSLQLLSEYEYQVAFTKQINQAFQLSCDAHQFSTLLN